MITSDRPMVRKAFSEPVMYCINQTPAMSLPVLLIDISQQMTDRPANFQGNFINIPPKPSESFDPVTFDHRVREQFFAHFDNGRFRCSIGQIHLDHLALPDATDPLEAERPEGMAHRFTLRIQNPVLEHHMHAHFHVGPLSSLTGRKRIAPRNARAKPARRKTPPLSGGGAG